MAEAVFAHHLRDAGLAARIEADSAGTGHWHAGEPAHDGTRRVLARHGIPYDGRARVIRSDDLETFDYVVTMDAQNQRDVERLRGLYSTAVVAPLMSYLPGAEYAEVPDPYYDGRFELVYDLVERATSALLETIRQERGM
jgi:protein-tyrosine phosphatase